jgi:hypothetical protein
VLDLDDEIDRLHRAKEEAVANQDFELAAQLRDQADRLKHGSAKPKIHHEMKKPETFVDRLRARIGGFAKILLDEIPELDAVNFTFVYNESLGHAVDPVALIFQRDPDSPLTRARVANAVGQTAVIVTNQLAAGFREAMDTIRDIEIELNAKRTAVEASASKGEAASGGNPHTGGTA